MLNLMLWLGLLLGFGALVLFAWRSAMRRRGMKLLQLLQGEEVLRYALDVPVALGERRAAGGPLSRRGTVILTRKRLAGFSHRARFVLVRGGGARRDSVSADGEWLVVKPRPGRSGGRGSPTFAFRVPDPAAWSADARRVLRV